MAVQFQNFHEFYYNQGNGNIDLDSDTFKAVLTNTAPTIATDDELADISEISDGNGYTTGGLTLSSVTFSEEPSDTGRWIFTCADFTWTATGGPIGPFRYVVIYDDTSTGDKLVGVFDFGTALTVPADSYFQVDIGADGIMKFGKGTLDS